MKKMIVVIICFVAGLAVCSALLRRHYHRTRSAPPAHSRVEDIRALDAWQNGIQLDSGTTYGTDPAAKERLLEILHREEARQRPQEGRN